MREKFQFSKSQSLLLLKQRKEQMTRIRELQPAEMTGHVTHCTLWVKTEHSMLGFLHVYL